MYRSLSISMYSLNKTTMDDFTTSFKSDFITSSFIFSKSRLNCNWVIINSSYFVFVVENIVSQGVNMTLFVYPFLLHNYMDLINSSNKAGNSRDKAGNSRNKASNSSNKAENSSHHSINVLNKASDSNSANFPEKENIKIFW